MPEWFRVKPKLINGKVFPSSINTKLKIKYNKDNKQWLMKERAKPIIIGKNEEFCRCQICGSNFKIDILIPDELWEIIKPKNKPKGAGLLCGSCIFRRLEEIYPLLLQMGISAFNLKPVD